MKKLKVLGHIFFWLTLISFPISFMVATEIAESDVFGVAGMVRYIWIMWLFIPIGVISIITGVKLKKNGQKHKKNFIIAFICIPLLLIFGSCRFLFVDTISYDVNQVSVIEEKTNVALPNNIKVATDIWDSYDEICVKILDEESKYNFETEIENNPLWQDTLKTSLKSLLPVSIQVECNGVFDYFVFYNVTCDEYNTFPPTGEYECVFIAYEIDLSRIVILDMHAVTVN